MEPRLASSAPVAGARRARRTDGAGGGQLERAGRTDAHAGGEALKAAATDDAIDDATDHTTDDATDDAIDDATQVKLFKPQPTTKLGLTLTSVGSEAPAVTAIAPDGVGQAMLRLGDVSVPQAFQPAKPNLLPAVTAAAGGTRAAQHAQRSTRTRDTGGHSARRTLHTFHASHAVHVTHTVPTRYPHVSHTLPHGTHSTGR